MSGISLVCFTASYSVALVLEATRLFFRSSVRGALLLGFAAAGLIAHTLYLVTRALHTQAPAVYGWYDWFLLAAWILAATYLYLTIYHRRQPIGLFLLPLILGMILVAYWFRGDSTFAASRRMLGWVHGLSLLVGTVVVVVGFVAGLMYLIQAARLKQKRPAGGRLNLPSLEWSQQVNSRSMIISTILLGVGVLTGLTMNALDRAAGGTVAAVPWTDPVVWSSGLLLLWLIAASLFGAVYRPARQGRKVAYLTVASMIFLLMALGVVLLAPSQHPSQAESRGEGPGASGEGRGASGEGRGARYEDGAALGRAPVWPAGGGR